jgi:glutamate N-acetyltransferase/amino-acid N-acetyltransferase
VASVKVERVARIVPGFRAAGIHAGIKAQAKDLALIVADERASAAGVFTRSTVVGAPVEVSRARVKRGIARAVVVNSGCSNVAMGARGIRDAHAMARIAAKAIGCDESEILIASTGVIGQPLPLDVLARGIPQAVTALSESGIGEAAEAIRTTDTFAKLASTTLVLGGEKITLQGIAKGAGMIEPNMATMLAFLTTDAKIAPALLRGMLRRVADATFNRLSVDGETSTSDSVMLLASGRAMRTALRPGSRDAARFEAALQAVCEDLVRQLARDGEGATKLVLVDARQDGDLRRGPELGPHPADDRSRADRLASRPNPDPPGRRPGLRPRPLGGARRPEAGRGRVEGRGDRDPRRPRPGPRPGEALHLRSDLRVHPGERRLHDLTDRPGLAPGGLRTGGPPVAARRGRSEARRVAGSSKRSVVAAKAVC